MTDRAKDEMRKIGETGEVHISPLGDDGRTYRTPTRIWAVMVDDALYVRAYKGESALWYQAALRQKAGRISGAGITQEVTFEPVEGTIGNRIDDAYRVKYKGSPYVGAMISAGARAATLKVTLRERTAG